MGYLQCTEKSLSQGYGVQIAFTKSIQSIHSELLRLL